jgi:CheY-like chemotaxis protein
MDGFEATAQIRSTHPELPIIAVTASAMANDRERCLIEGLSDYIAKPVELELLEMTLNKWLTDGVTKPASKDAPVEDLSGSIFDSESLLHRLMGDRELAGKLLKGFIQDFPSQLNILSMRINAADAPGVHAQAHLLKGAAATVSAERLRSAAMALDEAGRKGQIDNCGELLQRAVEQFDEYKNTLKRDGWI